MEVGRHQAKAEKAHGDAGACLAQQRNEGMVIVVVVKDAGALVTPVEDMVTVSADGGSCGARHPEMIVGPATRRKQNLSEIKQDGYGMGVTRFARKTLNVPDPRA
jgi:hypothetical protein